MDFISFRIKGRVGHFLRAESGASALSYPVPPRTAIMGLVGAVLGMGKDRPQEDLKSALFAVSGKKPKTFWHRIKLRKEDPEILPRRIKKKKKLADETGKSASPTLILQEWLFEPEYEIWASLPEPFQSELELRLKDGRWHFQPCLGLSEMMAELSFCGREESEPLPEATHRLASVFPASCGKLDVETAYEEQLSLNLVRMPRSVTPDRAFTLGDYYMEREGRPVPVETSQAFRWREKVIVCL